MVPTRLHTLDVVTGGLREGTVWCVTGPAGVGLSTLAAQLASAAAATGGRTLLVSCLDDVTMVADRSDHPDLTVMALPADQPMDVAANVGTKGWRVVVVDDVDWGARSDVTVVLTRLRGIAQRRRCTVVCTARDVVSPAGEVTEPWCRLADVVLTLDWPDLRDLRDRPAQVDVHVVRNRVGPRAQMTFVLNERAKRFTELVC